MVQKLVQNRASHITQRANVSTMQVSLSWLKAEELHHMLKVPNGLFKQLAHSSDTHMVNTTHGTRGLFTVPRSRTEAGKHTVLNTAMTTWNSLPPQVTQ